MYLNQVDLRYGIQMCGFNRAQECLLCVTVGPLSYTHGITLTKKLAMESVKGFATQQ